MELRLSNCRALRSGTFHGKARTQTQVAVTEDGRDWFLLGASPDLRAQIEATPELYPREGVRQSPVAGVVLANADLDHVLGLLLLRELQPLRIHATASVREILRDDNTCSACCSGFPGRRPGPTSAQEKEFALSNSKGEDSGLRCRAFAGHALSGLRHSRAAIATRSERILARVHPAVSNGLALAYHAGGSASRRSTARALEAADVLLFDGTFWSEDELIRVQGSGQTAQQMGPRSA